jgi:ABC-type transporter Mla subunit MlaD
MGNERKGRTETLVGLFLFVGLAILGMLVVTFGRLGQGLKTPYELTVLFPNATGLTAGADVLLAGAKIGLISSSPQLVGDSYRVAVRVKIQGTIHIPRKSKFTVGSAGLLGDKFVDVVPLSENGDGDFWQAGEVIEGSQSGGLDELAVRGGAVLEQLAQSLKQVQTLTANLNQQLLNETNIKNIQQTFENLRDVTATFKKTSLSLDQTVEKVDTFLGTANSAMKTLDNVGKEIRPAIADIKTTTERASKAAESVQKLTKSATEGKGALGVLVNDKETADNLRSLISNLRRSGVLFYKDRPATPEERKVR